MKLTVTIENDKGEKSTISTDIDEKSLDLNLYNNKNYNKATDLILSELYRPVSSQLRNFDILKRG